MLGLIATSSTSLELKSLITSQTHGTGFTLVATIVANLCLKKDIFLTVQQSKLYVTSALEYSLTIGKGQGFVRHFYPFFPLA
ncbi:bifunctional hydroxymethylpyrimidine kinase/phosphomethylpyrimidine kinase [Planktothrix pseudagardhii]|uniref:Hydroxymethylpyrimidine/phosphomethylpyrimidine kinase n=1 Tax=Planktothrix pseudagardhii TaxID=132604 RepID=A0A9W4CH85_9CYAN|nr:Hydroxymethylpyrimidine/phosphomethylpyrimidine kinase [Planktothrix pseudagardhii]